VKTTVLLLSGLVLAAPVAAQDPPSLSIRPFVMAAEQAFAATTTFDAVFGRAHAPFFGGGVQVVLLDRIVVEVGASRFRQTGERVFRSGDQNFKLGIPLTATITPVEITGGYRFPLWEHARPYVAAGVGSYAYTETSESSDPGENLDTRRTGFVANGGFEFRVHRWVGFSIDVQYSHIPDILGTSGISQQVGEKDLGGVAARFKLIVGR
jgi:opacity protein-like surface antigen